MLVDGEHVDASRWQCLLSAVGDAVSFRYDSPLSRRNNVLPVGIDSYTENTRVVVPGKIKYALMAVRIKN